MLRCLDTACFLAPVEHCHSSLWFTRWMVLPERRLRTRTGRTRTRAQRHCHRCLPRCSRTASETPLGLPPFCTHLHRCRCSLDSIVVVIGSSLQWHCCLYSRVVCCSQPGQPLAAWVTSGGFYAPLVVYLGPALMDIMLTVTPAEDMACSWRHSLSCHCLCHLP
jgi:hypothetical protein